MINNTTKDMIGWICPRCQQVNAPSVSQCDCKPEYVSAGPWPTQPYIYPNTKTPYHPPTVISYRVTNTEGQQYTGTIKYNKNDFFVLSNDKLNNTLHDERS